MRLKRFLRDFAVLAGFCGAFYLLTVAVSRLDEEPQDDSDFSPARKRADVSMRTRDWESASVDFLSLAEKDPYNGHAWYHCASSFKNRRIKIFDEIRAVRANAREVESETTSLETQELLYGLQAELDELNAHAKAAFKRSKEFARYRAGSLLHLAAIESYEGNKAASLGYLDEFVDNGYRTDKGISVYPVFGVGGAKYTSPIADIDDPQVRLHSEPKFWEIVRKEGFNR